MTFRRWLVVLPGELTVAVGIGLLAELLVPGLPCRLFSGIAAGVLVPLLLRRFGIAARVNRTVREIGLATAGLCIGASVSLAALGNAGPRIPLYVGLSLTAIVVGCLLGCLYSRASGSDRCTGMLAMFPGALGAVTAVAEDKGKDASTISAVQTFRIATVLMVVAGLSSIGEWDSVRPAPATGSTDPLAFLIFAAVLAPTWLLYWVLRGISAPLPGFFAGLLVGFACYVLLAPMVPLPASPPKVISELGQLLLGIAAGESIGAGLRLRSRALSVGALGVLATVGTGLGTAALVHAATGLDWLTCVLMTAPGSPSEITVFALALPVQVELVTLAQLVRQVVGNLALSPLVWLFSRRDAPGQDGAGRIIAARSSRWSWRTMP